MSSSYPVRVDATLQDGLSRWLWLVKWILAIPHYIVLVFLWAAFVLLSLVAMFAILFTGRYPRSVFEFNVGVLRWSWRVAYYAYGALGTDRYPPFTLAERPDYPAHLEIAYPDHLSRGLVLVKWWLLAIPHYLVLALVVGGGWYIADGQVQDDAGGTPGLITLLVLIAAVALLFTGRYPGTIYDLVLGLNRWVLRVAAYAGLMTDTYPPFRLDMGGTDPGTALLSVAPAGSSVPAAEPRPSATAQAPGPPRRWGAGRVIAVVLGSVLALGSLGLVAGAGVLWVADEVVRDDDGYLTGPSQTYESDGYAVVSESIEIHTGSTAIDLPRRWLGTVKVEFESQGDAAAFVGIASSDDADAYLRGVASSKVTDSFGDDGEPVYDFTDGVSPRSAPTDETIWVASARGHGQQSLTWEPSDGKWTLVAMNGAGTAPVSVDVAIGATVPALDEIALVLLVSGLVLLGVSAVILVAALRRPSAR